MQTDPNFSNFLWNPQTRKLALIDFGATREYNKDFMDNWLRLLQSAANEDRDACIHWSLKLGYLIGKESEVCVRLRPSACVRFKQTIGHVGRTRQFNDPSSYTFQTHNPATFRVRSWNIMGGYDQPNPDADPCDATGAVDTTSEGDV